MKDLSAWYAAALRAFPKHYRVTGPVSRAGPVNSRLPYGSVIVLVSVSVAPPLSVTVKVIVRVPPEK